VTTSTKTRRPDRTTDGVRPAATPALIAGMGALAALATPALAAGAPRPDGPFTLTLWMIVLLTAAAELAAVHVHGEQHSHTLSVSEVALVVGLAFAAPGDLVLGRALAGLVVYGAYRRLPLPKLAFNTALVALESTMAALVYRTVLGGASPAEPAGWLAALAAVAASTIVGIAAIRIILAIHRDPGPGGAILSTALVSITITAAGTLVGILGVAALWHHTLAFTLIGALAGFVYLTARFCTNHLAIRDILRRLDTVLREAGSPREATAGALALARSGLHGTVARAACLTPEGEAFGLSLGPDGLGELVDEDPDRLALTLAVLGDGGRAARLSPQAAGLLDLPANRGLDRPILAPIRREGRTVGYLAAAGKRAPQRRFTDGDLRLLGECARRLALP